MASQHGHKQALACLASRPDGCTVVVASLQLMGLLMSPHWYQRSYASRIAGTVFDLFGALMNTALFFFFFFLLFFRRHSFAVQNCSLFAAIFPSLSVLQMVIVTRLESCINQRDDGRLTTIGDWMPANPPLTFILFFFLSFPLVAHTKSLSMFSGSKFHQPLPKKATTNHSFSLRRLFRDQPNPCASSVSRLAPEVGPATPTADIQPLTRLLHLIQVPHRVGSFAIDFLLVAVVHE